MNVGNNPTDTSINNAILANSIVSNAGLGIDLGNDGVTLDTSGGPHTGPDHLQNFPVLTSAVVVGGTTTIAGTLNSTPLTNFIIQFFANAAADPSGFGEGQQYLGQTKVTSDGSGNARFSVTLSTPPLVGQFFTATATDDPAGNTSEFSQDISSGTTVTNTNDSGPGSLRQAIRNADANPGLDTITFAPGLSGTIVLTSGELQITDDVTIDGPGAALISVSGNNASRVFEVDLVHAAISGLTITGGLADQGGGIWNQGDLSVTGCIVSDNHSFSVETGSGGGIYNSGGQLTVDSCTIERNTARDGGGIANYGGGDTKVVSCTLVDNTCYYGGGIRNAGSTLTVNSSTIERNSANYTGGGILNGFDDPGAMTVAVVSSCTIEGNTARGFEGGGIFNSKTLTVNSCTIAGNSADRGGGISNWGSLTVGASTISGNSAALRGGGGIYNSGPLALAGSTISGNSATGDGGGIYNDAGVALAGVTISGNSANDSGGGIENLGTLTVTGGSKLTDNSAGRFGGGGIYNGGTATVTGGTLSGNHAANGGSGGAINNVSGATLMVADSTLSDNSAALNGGGIDNFGTTMLTNCTLSDNSADFNGGGVYNASNRTLTVSGSTFTDNSATGDGGGIYNASTGTATISGSTIRRNTAGGSGGGVYNADLLTIYSSPISGNTAGDNGGGVYNTGRWTIYSSPISGNTAGRNGGGVYNAGGWTIYNSPISGNTAGGNGDDVYNIAVAGKPNLPPSNNTQPAIQLVPAQNSSLALIATLVVTSLNGVESSGTASVSPNQAIAPSGKGGESAHEADESANPLGGLSILIPTALRPWVLVLLGTNEALARIRGTIPDLSTSGDGQQGPVELLSRAYQAVLRSIDEAIPGMVLEGLTPSLRARTKGRDIDKLAGDLAREGPARTEPDPSAVPVAAGPAHDPAEVLPDTSKSTLFRLVEILAVSVASIGALTFTRVFLRYRQRHLRLGIRTIPAPKPA